MYLYPYQAPPFVQPQQLQQSIQYVNGKQGADSYQMAANSSVILMDTNLPRFYMKQTDASGIATIHAYDFTELEEDKPEEFVTKKEFESFKAKMEGVNNESTYDARKQQYDDASHGCHDARRESAGVFEESCEHKSAVARA